MTSVSVCAILLAFTVTCELLPVGVQRSLPADFSDFHELREHMNSHRKKESSVSDVSAVLSGQDTRFQQTSLMGSLLAQLTSARYRSLLPLFSSPHIFMPACCPKLSQLCSSAGDCALKMSYCIDACICPHSPRLKWCTERSEYLKNIENKKTKQWSTVRKQGWFDRFQKYVLWGQDKRYTKGKFIFAARHPRVRHQASFRRHIRSANFGAKTGSPSARNARSVETKTNSSLGDKSGFLSVSTEVSHSTSRDHAAKSGSHTRLGEAEASSRISEQAPFLATEEEELKSVKNKSMDSQENKHKSVPPLSQSKLTISSVNTRSGDNQTDIESITINSDSNQKNNHNQTNIQSSTFIKTLNNESIMEVQASESCGTDCSLRSGRCILEIRDDMTRRSICLYEQHDLCQVLRIPCLHGRCVTNHFSPAPLKWWCKCVSGWTGQLCNVECGLDCGHHGRCEVVLDRPVCVCHPDYTGDGCDDLALGFVPLADTDGSQSNTTTTTTTITNNSDIHYDYHSNNLSKDVSYEYSQDEHNPFPCGVDCTTTGGTCLFDYNMTCVYERGDPCRFLNCLHGACTSMNNVHKCECDASWTGYRCEIPCQLDCGQHGVCDVIQTRTICRCHKNYTGVHCTDLVPQPLIFTGDVLNDDAVMVWQITAGCLGVVAGVLVILLLLAYVTWRKQWLPMRKFVHFFQQYEEDDGKKYDAFVSYRSRSSDEEFVLHELYPHLERHLNFKLCMHFRDFPPGETIADNIINAIENSRRTILVLSPAYVQSEWCRLEFQKAQHEMLKLRHKVIPLVLEDVSHMQPMDSRLRALLDTVTYLQWPGKVDSKRLDKFWKLLQLSMPKKKRDYSRSISSTGSCSSDRPLTAVPSTCFSNIVSTMNTHEGPEHYESVFVTSSSESVEEEEEGCQHVDNGARDNENRLEHSKQQGEQDMDCHEYCSSHKCCYSDGDQNSDSGCCRDRAFPSTSDGDFPSFRDSFGVDNASCAQTFPITSDDHMVEIRDCPGDNVKIVRWLPARLSTRL